MGERAFLLLWEGLGWQLYGLQKVTRDYDKTHVLLSFTYNVFGDADRTAPEGISYMYGGMKHGQLTAWLPYMIKPGKKLEQTEEGAKYMTFGTRVPDAGSEITDYVQATLTGSGVSDNKEGETEWYSAHHIEIPRATRREDAWLSF